MDTFRRRLKNRRIFLGKDAKLGKRVRQEFVDNGIATVPCKVSGYEDIISSYSVEYDDKKYSDEEINTIYEDIQNK